jgi:SNF2 family DNA or RNA helicase
LSKTLYPFQARALGRLPKEGGYLAFEQGLGKTLTAIEYAFQWKYDSVLVIAPAVALGVWERELAEEGHSALLLTGTRKEKAKQLATRKRPDEWVVINYEVLLEPAVIRAIQKWSPDLIILDEAHKIKTATAKRSKAVHKLGREFPVLALSGTPITKNLLDLYSQYKAIDPDIWGGESWTRFKQRYGVWGGYGGYELIGYQNTEQLKDLIRDWTVVASKEDELDLPPKIFQQIPVKLTGKSWISYGKMARDGVNEEWVTTNPLEKSLRLAQIASRAKVRATVDFVENLREQGEQVVVYGRFLEDIYDLSVALEVPAITGNTRQKDRTRYVEEFQAGKLPVFLAQISAASTGITLTNATHMVYHGLTFAYEDWAQSQDRIHRIGQEQPCNYYYITATGPKGGITIDGLVLYSIDTKQDVAAMVTKDPSLLLPQE